MPRKILHLDLDAFFCAVEELRDPSLRGRPFAVGGKPEERGVVSSCSYAARRFGVRSAMPMSRALKACPGLLVIPGRHRNYHEASERVMTRVRGLTPLVEQISIDEAFLDVSDLPQPPEALARQVQADIRQAINLPCSLGAATNKLVAKIATDVGKASSQTDTYPNAITVVPPGAEAAFLAPLPAQALWGVGPKTAERLTALGLRTIGDIARWPQNDLARRFGKMGAELWVRAQGLDDRPVVSSYETKSISQEVTFARDENDAALLRQTLRDLSDGVGRRLRHSELGAVTVKLKLRWPDFTTLSRQATVTAPIDQDDDLFAVAMQLFGQVWRPGRRVRLLGVGVSGLGPRRAQLALLDDGAEKKKRLQEAVDALKDKFGETIVHRGRRGF
jgi:DNA polymerase-4